MNKERILEVVDQLLTEFGFKFSWEGRNYFEDILMELITNPGKKTNTQLYQKVVDKRGLSGIDCVERNIRYCLTHIDYSSAVAQKLFSTTKSVSNKEAIYALLHELNYRLSQ